MQGTELELELRERLLVQGDTFSINGNRKLTEQVNQKVIEALQEESVAKTQFTSAGRIRRRGAKRKKRSKISNYSYYLQTMEENKSPLELLPETTRFKKVKQIILRMMQLVFQYQQLFNKATEDVLILMTRDLKSLDMRQQGLEEKLDTRVLDILEDQDDEIRRLKAEVEELKEKQLNLEAELSQCRGECTEAGEDA